MHGVTDAKEYIWSETESTVHKFLTVLLVMYMFGVFILDMHVKCYKSDKM